MTLELVDLDKRYPNGVHAVRSVTLSIRPGEVHSIVGENGAGKSTLMKLVYGLERPSSGHLVKDGRRLAVDSPRRAIEAGIGMVHQNLMLVPSLTIAENVVLGREPGRGLVVDRSAATETTLRLASECGLTVDPSQRVSEASVGARQRTAILRALGRGARVLILDEPTAVLTPQEADDLLGALARLRESGLTVVFVSHKLDEVRAISDRVSVMRDGRLITTHDDSETSAEQLAAEMVGRDVSLTVARSVGPRVDSTVLSLRDVVVEQRGGEVGPVSFDVRPGEVVGIAGIEGSGQGEVVRAVAGLLRHRSGAIRVAGQDVGHLSVAGRRALGVAHIPEDRLFDGTAPTLSIEQNLIVDRHTRPPVGSRLLVRPRAARALAGQLIAEFAIRAPDARTPVGSLSGGNMQKVVIAREFSSRPMVLLAAHPTRGVDVGAMEYIYEQFMQARAAGLGILLISADLTELLALSDRLLVMRDGALVGRFDETQSLTEASVGRFMLGLASHDPDVIMAGLDLADSSGEGGHDDR